ncbi:hypothetical protein [Neptunomonas phycophila]|uniref:hypothetical protein n=1 Tax=Neptunomonas phycophila TaxID=1572645 RepID=UPI0035159724
MIKRRALFLAFAIELGCTVSTAHGSSSLSDDCAPLLQAVEAAKTARINKAVIESATITGGQELSTAACIGTLMDIDFDFFSGIGSWSGVLNGVFSKVKNQVKDAFTNMVCDVSNDLKANADTFLSCSASLDVSLDAAAGMDVPDLAACLGAGDAFNLDFSQGVSVGNGSTSIGIGKSLSTGSSSSNSSSLLNSLKSKVDSVNSLRSKL